MYMKIKICCIFAIVLPLFCQCQKLADGRDLPSVITGEPNHITENSAVISGGFSGLSVNDKKISVFFAASKFKDKIERYTLYRHSGIEHKEFLEYSEYNDIYESDFEITRSESSYESSTTLRDLEPNTLYYYIFGIHDGCVELHGAIKSFKTNNGTGYNNEEDDNEGGNDGIGGSSGGDSSGGGNSGDTWIYNAEDLSYLETANCYVVSSVGSYKFPAYKGNSTTSVGAVSSVEVLWESFGTSVTPVKGDLISRVQYKDGYVYFSTPSYMEFGNAVIAAKNTSGTILWSWHIWLTAQPQEHVYNNNAGTMMDRNLGATSATPGDVGTLGLLYQWGRKDPFLGSSSISDAVEAKSTIIWPSAVSSNSSIGTIGYAIANPTTFITYKSNNYDWQYNQDDIRWQSKKTIYDPCPAGWRVPDGGSRGVWAMAGFDDTTYDSTNEGISFNISYLSTTWYPASGLLDSSDGSLANVGYVGSYWSCSPNDTDAYYLSFDSLGDVYPLDCFNRARGFPVRCLQE